MLNMQSQQGKEKTVYLFNGPAILKCNDFLKCQIAVGSGYQLHRLGA